jgi:epsin
MQPFEDPFGDSPFKAIPSTDSVLTQQQISASTNSFQPTVNQTAELPQLAAPRADTVSNLGFGDTFSSLTYSGPTVSGIQPPTNSQYFPQELSTPQQNTDILADILPPSGPSPAFTSQPAFAAPTGQPAQPTANIYGTFHPQAGPIVPQIQAGAPAQLQAGFTSLPTSQMAPQTPAGPTSQLNGGNVFPQHVSPQAPTGPAMQFNSGNFLPAQGAAAPVATHIAHQTPTGPAVLHNNDRLGNLLPQAGLNAPVTSQQNLSSSIGSLSIVPQPAKDKFETKSTVWADTLSRGLVNLNISGCECFMLANIIIIIIIIITNTNTNTIIIIMALDKALLTS